HRRPRRRPPPHQRGRLGEVLRLRPPRHLGLRPARTAHRRRYEAARSTDRHEAHRRARLQRHRRDARTRTAHSGRPRRTGRSQRGACQRGLRSGQGSQAASDRGRSPRRRLALRHGWDPPARARDRTEPQRRPRRRRGRRADADLLHPDARAHGPRNPRNHHRRSRRGPTTHRRRTPRRRSTQGPAEPSFRRRLRGRTLHPTPARGPMAAHLSDDRVEHGPHPVHRRRTREHNPRRRGLGPPRSRYRRTASPTHPPRPRPRRDHRTSPRRSRLMSMTAPLGSNAAGLTAGLKPSCTKYLSLIINTGPSDAVAAVYTSNRCKANPVLWSQKASADGHARAVVLNSGGANCYTGDFGYETTTLTAQTTADALTAAGTDTKPEDILVCSTGLIGVGGQGFRDAILSHLPPLVAASDSTVEAGQAAAEAIMTTD